MSMVKGIVIVIKSPPYGSGRVAEGLRMATAMVAMDVMPQILFIDDGVYCLLKNQQPEAAGLHSFSERLKTLADLVGLHVVSDSMTKRSLRSGDLDLAYNLKVVSLEEAAESIAENEAVITF